MIALVRSSTTGRMGLDCMEAISRLPDVSYYGFPMRLGKTPEGHSCFSPAARILRRSRRPCPPRSTAPRAGFYAKADLLPPIGPLCPPFLRKGIHEYSQKMAGREFLPILPALHERPPGSIAIS